MELFGLDIRKRTTSIGSLYRGVDAIIEKEKSVISKETVKDTVAHSLHRMIKLENRFSVCTIRDLSKLSNIVISYERENFYSSIHCMAWNEMLPDFRAKVVAFIFDDFRSILNEEETIIKEAKVIH